MTRLNYTSLYGKSTSAYHAQVKDALDRGELVIACMGPGNWTSSGHYVLVWGIQGDTIYINDPASTKAARTKGSYSLFRQQVKYYWTIERPDSVPGDDEQKEDELNMTKKEFLDSLTNEEAYQLVQKAELHAKTMPEPDWSKKEGAWAAAIAKGITDGTAPERPVKRCEAMAWMDRLGLLE